MPDFRSQFPDPSESDAEAFGNLRSRQDRLTFILSHVQKNGWATRGMHLGSLAFLAVLACIAYALVHFTTSSTSNPPYRDAILRVLAFFQLFFVSLVVPMLMGSWSSLLPGTPKAPGLLFGCGAHFQRRNFVDLAVHIIHVLSLFALMFIPSWHAVAIATATSFIYAWLFDPEFHEPLYILGVFFIPFAYPYDQGGHAALQILLITQMVLCGVCKVGPWGTAAVAYSMTLSPFMAWLRRLVYKKGQAPSIFGHALTGAAAAIEIVAPLSLLLLSWNKLARELSIAVLVTVHFTAVVTLPMPELTFNVWYIIAWVFSFSSFALGESAAGFDVAGISRMHPSLAAILIFIVAVSCYRAFRYEDEFLKHTMAENLADGNYAAALLVVRKGAMQKLEACLNTSGPPPVWCQGATTERFRDLVARLHLGCTHMSVSLAEALVSWVVDHWSVSIGSTGTDDYDVTLEWSSCSIKSVLHYFGVVNRWGQLVNGPQNVPVDSFFEKLATVDSLEVGDVVYVWVSSWSRCQGTSTFVVRDAKQGLLWQGTLHSSDAVALMESPTTMFDFRALADRSGNAAPLAEHLLGHRV